MNYRNQRIHYCRKCGCELMSTNKYRLCDYCRQKRMETIRKWALIVLGITVSGVAVETIEKKNHDDKEKKNE